MLGTIISLGYAQSREDMLQCGKGYAVDISSLKRICSIKRGYAALLQRICNEHMLFEKNVLHQEVICSTVAKDMQWTYPL